MSEMENIVMTITEMNDNLDDTRDLPVYYKYRYTFDKDTDVEAQKKRATEMIKVIKERYMCSPLYTAGIEHYTKGMVSCKPHLHIHFISKKSSNTIRKGLALEFNLIGRCQACKAEVIVDEDKFFRYPLKQQKNNTYIKCWSSFPKEESQMMIDVAYACWIQAAEIAVGKLEKKVERTSEDRLFLRLDKYFELEDPKDYNSILKFALMYYAEHEPCFNYTTIVGYVDKYLIKHEKMSLDRYLLMKGASNFDLI